MVVFYNLWFCFHKLERTCNKKANYCVTNMTWTTYFCTFPPDARVFSPEWEKSAISPPTDPGRAQSSNQKKEMAVDNWIQLLSNDLILSTCIETKTKKSNIFFSCFNFHIAWPVMTYYFIHLKYRSLYLQLIWTGHKLNHTVIAFRRTLFSPSPTPGKIRPLKGKQPASFA